MPYSILRREQVIHRALIAEGVDPENSSAVAIQMSFHRMDDDQLLEHIQEDPRLRERLQVIGAIRHLPKAGVENPKARVPEFLRNLPVSSTRMRSRSREPQAA